MDLGLEGRTAIVMGASQGLGEACAHQLAIEGAHVILVSRREKELKQVRNSIEERGGSAELIVCDLFEGASRKKLRNLISAMARVDILIANSGGPAPGTAPGISSDIWLKEFDAMVLGIIEIIDETVGNMRGSGFGRIIVIGSSGMVCPIPKLAVSNTLRSAVGGYLKTLAEQVAALGITCNMVLPGRVETPRTKAIDISTAKAMKISEEQARQNSVAVIPAGRYGRPDEFGSVVAFLASEQAGYITGSQIRVDGGAIRSVNT